MNTSKISQISQRSKVTRFSNEQQNVYAERKQPTGRTLSGSEQSSEKIKDVQQANNSGGSSAQNTAAKAILINKLEKYINYKQENNNLVSNFNPQKAIQKEDSPVDTERKEEILDNLKQFLKYLETKKIINITEVVQDKQQVNSLIQDIV